MRLTSDPMIRQGKDPVETYFWPEKPIPSPTVELTIKGGTARAISLNDDKLTIELI